MVHVGMLIFIPLFAAAVYVLMRDVEEPRRGSAGFALIRFVIFDGASRRCRGSASAPSSTN